MLLELGQTITIDDRVGAGGNIGPDAAARAKPDGCAITIMLATVASHGLSPALYDNLNHGSGGVGSSQHLAGASFKKIAGVDITHIPSKGASPVPRPNNRLDGSRPLINPHATKLTFLYVPVTVARKPAFEWA